MNERKYSVRARTLDARFILPAALTLLMLAALMLLGAGRAGAQEYGPGQIARNAEVTDAGVAVTIGADLTANDGSGQTAPWVLSYDALGEPTHLTVKVEAPYGSGAPVTYSAKLDAADVNDLIQWLSAVKAKMDAAAVR